MGFALTAVWMLGGALALVGCGSSSSQEESTPPASTAGAGGAAGQGGSGGTGGAGGASGKGGSAGKGGGECVIKGQDPSTLGPSCCDMGSAHCVDDSSVPGNLAGEFPTCSTTSGKAGHCMPDTIIKAGSDYVPATCEMPVFKVEGRCLSKCIPRIGNDPNAKLLQKATCTEGEVCVPCVSPLDNKPTGACELPEPGCPGAAGAGGSAGSAGASGSAGSGPACPYEGPPVIDPGIFPPCTPACGGAHCLPSSLVPAEQASQLAACKGTDGSDGYCAPDTFISTGGNGVPKGCTSVAGAEGRCLSTCLPAIAAQASLLPKADCAEGEVCAPCFNPTAADPNEPTGACSLACDKPAKPPTVLACPYTGPEVIDTDIFPPCSPACGGAHCVPESLIPAEQASLLAKCDGGYCAPDSILRSGGQGVPKSCTSVAGAEGRCVSTCLPSIAEQASLLPKADCAEGEVCAPCFNPFDADPTAPTGACSLACDKPKNPPLEIKCPYTGPPVIDVKTFPPCSPACGGAHCVPESLIPAEQASLLAKCDGGYCAPDLLVETGGNGVPKSCTSVAGAEGRCLSTCLPSIAEQASLLPKADCAEGEVCAPCFNPTADDPKAPTGACSLACDKPAKPPTVLTCPYKGPDVVDPAIFPACSPACGGAHCVPESMIPAEQASLLAKCSGGYCAPDSIIRSGGQGVPKSCTSVAGAEGRCVSTCLPSIAEQAKLLPQDVCGADERCAPCFNPTADDPKAPTGACSLACDKPAKPPTVLTCPYTGPEVIDTDIFPPCSPACGGAHCVPASLISPEDASQLAACKGADGAAGYCAPDSIVASGGFGVPKTCTAFKGTSAEGRCQSKCLPAIAAQADQLSQDVCTSNELCAPCFDPITGADTGACKLSCDAPKKPAFSFPKCCVYKNKPQGTCVPKSSIPDGQEGSLEVDSCPAGPDYLCVPEEYLPNSTVPVQNCSTLFGKGACVSDCIDQGIFGIFLTQGTCPDNHSCAPCSLAPAGTPGCD